MRRTIHIKHHVKGHVRPNFEHPRLDARDTEEFFETSREAIPVRRRLPVVHQAEAPNGVYPILDAEQELRKARSAMMNYLPWPTQPERGLYSRQQMNEDMAAINAYEACITSAIARGDNRGLDSLKAYRVCDLMRQNCKTTLMRTIAILQAKDVESKLKQHPITMTFKGIVLPPAQCEHIRRMATDRAYLLSQIQKKESTSGKANRSS